MIDGHLPCQRILCTGANHVSLVLFMSIPPSQIRLGNNHNLSDNRKCILVDLSMETPLHGEDASHPYTPAAPGAGRGGKSGSSSLSPRATGAQ